MSEHDMRSFAHCMWACAKCGARVCTTSYRDDNESHLEALERFKVERKCAPTAEPMPTYRKTVGPFIGYHETSIDYYEWHSLVGDEVGTLGVDALIPDEATGLGTFRIVVEFTPIPRSRSERHFEH